MSQTQPAKDPAFERLLQFLKHHRGFDFTGYKRSSLMRRVRRRMQNVDIDTFEDYHDYLEVHPDEFAYLFNTILINVTAFFRDRAAWDFLEAEVIPQIIATNEEGETIRVWSAGCASGEEAYSLAMLFGEALGVEAASERVKIYATDVDEEALAQARHGGYSPEAMEAVPDALQEKYFERTGGRYVFRNDLRRAVVFGRHDLTQDAPISRLDLLVCRNTLIYLNAETQRRVLARFHFALNDGGFLFLGKAEMLLTHAHLFTPVELKHRIFSKVPEITLRDRMAVLTEASEDEAPGDQIGNYVRLREAAFATSPYPQIVVDRQGVLALANEQARERFDLAPQDIGRLFRDLVLSYRPAELRAPIERAKSSRRTITIEDVELPRNEKEEKEEKESTHLDIRVTPLLANGDRVLGVSITFEDVTRCHRLQEELHRSNQELETAYEEVQSTNEELETTNEEVQSTNEELETTNEELQSTVEELQTTNEELQSSNEEMETMNEELRTTNEELQAKNEELQARTADLEQTRLFLQSILTSVEIGVVVIDRDFEILLWNERAEGLWGLREDEVIGRSLLSLDIGLPVTELAKPVRALLAGEVEETEQEVSLEAVNRRGQTITIQATNTLRRGPAGEAEGVVLLMKEVKERNG